MCSHKFLKSDDSVCIYKAVAMMQHLFCKYSNIMLNPFCLCLETLRTPCVRLNHQFSSHGHIDCSVACSYFPIRALIRGFYSFPSQLLTLAQMICPVYTPAVSSHWLNTAYVKAHTVCCSYAGDNSLRNALIAEKSGKRRPTAAQLCLC